MFRRFASMKLLQLLSCSIFLLKKFSSICSESSSLYLILTECSIYHNMASVNQYRINRYKYVTKLLLILSLNRSSSIQLNISIADCIDYNPLILKGISSYSDSSRSSCWSKSSSIELLIDSNILCSSIFIYYQYLATLTILIYL